MRTASPQPEIARLRPVSTVPVPVWSVAAAWVVAVVAAASNGGFAATGPPLAAVVAVAVPLSGVATAYRSSATLRAWVADLDVSVILAFQTWRVVGVAFLFGWVAGDLPAGFAIPAAIGDVATGVAAVPIVIAATRGRLTRRRLIGFTALGLGDFLVAIVTGVALQPVALEMLPWVLFPTLAVPAFTILHLTTIVVFRERD